MKIGIITCHDVYNFGASLQAYALSEYIKKSGFEVEIIDYKPKYLYRLINFLEVDAPKWKRNFITRWCYRIIMVPSNLKRLKKAFVFKRFNNKYLSITSKKYIHNDELKKLNSYDQYICGSDQIWNSLKYPCGEDPAYYLSFAKGEKISYAASFGGNTVSEKGSENIRKYLPNFKAVSVREKSGVSILKDHDIDSVQVLDPVFFLDGDDWRKIARKPSGAPERYVLLYGYDNTQELTQALNEYTDSKNTEIITIDSPVFRNAGPLEFLWLIDNAEMVITTSFHAVSFSIIFHTPFITAMTGNEKLYERLEDIMKKCGLEQRRYIIMKQNGKKPDDAIDFYEVDKLLMNSKKKSEEFLLSALGAENGK